jgi:Calx-beta domain
LTNQHRSLNVSALALSAKFALALCSTMALNTVVHAESAAVNGQITMSAATYSVAQSAGSVTLTVERTGGTTGALQVTYVTGNDTAIAGTAYTAKYGYLTWASGDAANKTIVIPIRNTNTTGTKEFWVGLKAVGATLLGTHSSAFVNIVGSTTTTTAPPVTKSIKQWGVSCTDSIDETAQLKAALGAAANNAFTLVIDCPVRFHTGVAGGTPVAVPNGTTIEFQGAGELLTGGVGLTVANLSEVTFIDFNLTVL